MKVSCVQIGGSTINIEDDLQHFEIVVGLQMNYLHHQCESASDLLAPVLSELLRMARPDGGDKVGRNFCKSSSQNYSEGCPAPPKQLFLIHIAKLAFDQNFA